MDLAKGKGRTEAQGSEVMTEVSGAPSPRPSAFLAMAQGPDTQMPLRALSSRA